MIQSNVNGCVVRLERTDLTAMDIEALVFAARPDLALGSGFGNAIAVRGGPAIQEELKKLAPVPVGDAVVTGGGNLKAKWVVHAVVPRFQEADEDKKLESALRKALERAEEKGVARIAMPPLTSGFFGMPLDRCAKILFEGVKEHLGKGKSHLEEIVFCVKDSHEVAPFRTLIEAHAKSGGKR